jgi:hypothetical protein
VPFALPLVRGNGVGPSFVGAWEECLRRNEQRIEGGLNRDRPVWMWEEGYDLRDGQGPDGDGRLVYLPKSFDQDHDGRTKAELLDADPLAAWQVLLIEGGLTNLPRRGRGTTVGGRPQIEAGRTQREYLASLPGDEAGWTPETYVTAFLTRLERTGDVLDVETSRPRARPPTGQHRLRPPAVTD